MKMSNRIKLLLFNLLIVVALTKHMISVCKYIKISYKSSKILGCNLQKNKVNICFLASNENTVVNWGDQNRELNLYKLQWSKLSFNLKYNVTTHDEILKRNILEEAT